MMRDFNVLRCASHTVDASRTATPESIHAFSCITYTHLLAKMLLEMHYFHESQTRCNDLRQCCEPTLYVTPIS